MAEGYDGLPAYYAQSSDPLTPNLGLSLKGMDPIIAENFVLLDTNSGGSKVEVNGVSVTNPNFNNTLPAAPGGGTNVTWQVDGSGNVSAYLSIPSAAWSSLQNATANLTLNNAGFSTTFDQTSPVNWTWANTTASSGPSSGPAVVSSQFISISGTGAQANGSSINTIGATLLVAVIYVFNNGSGGTPTIADGSGNTWNYGTFQVSNQSSNGVLAFQVAYAYSHSGGALATSASDSFTVTNHGAGAWSAAIYAFSGTLTTSSVFDSGVSVGFANMTGSPSPFQAGWVIPSPGDIVISAIYNGNSVYTAPSVNQGFTNLLNGVTNQGAAAVYLNATGETLNPTWTYGSGGLSAGTFFCFKSTATTVANSPTDIKAGTWWNGSASAADSWTIQDTPGAAINGMSTLYIGHSGSPNGQVQITGGLSVFDNNPSFVHIANTTASTASSNIQDSPALSLDGTYWINGASAPDSWSIQNHLTNTAPSVTITNVAETAGNVVTLTVSGASFSSLSVGTTVTLSGLTTATWLNNLTFILTTQAPTSLTFSDYTGHGLLASTSETGTVTQANPTSRLVIKHTGSATCQIQVPQQNFQNAPGQYPGIVTEGYTSTGISIGAVPATALVLFAQGSANHIQFYNNLTFTGQTQNQITAGDFLFLGFQNTSGIGINQPAATNTYPICSIGHGSLTGWQSTTSGSNLIGLNVGNNINQVGNNSLNLIWKPTWGSSNFQAVNIGPTINQVLVTNTVVGSALVSNVGAIVFSTANAYTAGGLIQVSVGTNTALNGTQTLTTQAQRAGSPYTITNSVETAGSVVTLTIGTHSVASGDWIFVTGLTTATWLNGQTVKVTGVVANVSVNFVDLTSHGTSASHADTGTVACNYVTFALTNANITGSADTGTVIQQSTGTYTLLLANALETAVNSNTHKLLDLQLGGVSAFNVDRLGNTTIQNQVAATSGTPQSSPAVNISGQYWTGSASAFDKWSIQDVVGSGTNGTSVLTFTHSGTTGVAGLKLPSTAPSTVPAATLFDFNSASLCYSGAGGIFLTDTSVNFRLGFWDNSGAYKVAMASGGTVAWTASTTAANAGGDTGLSRLAAGVVGVGSGSQGSFAAQIIANNGFGVSLVSTAAITGAVPVKADTSNANQVVVTTTSDTGAGIVIGVCTNSPTLGGNAQVIDSGIVAMTLGTGTAAIGNFVIVDTTTNGRVKCTGTYTAGTVIGVAMSAQSTVGQTFNVKVNLR